MSANNTGLAAESSRLRGKMTFTSREQSNDILEMRHAALLLCFSNTPRCRIVGHVFPVCNEACEHFAPCGIGIKEKLSAILSTSYEEFSHEQAAMKQFNSHEHHIMHSALHGNLGMSINAVIMLLSTTKNRLKAIAGIDKIAEMFRHHTDTTDVEMMTERPSGSYSWSP